MSVPARVPARSSADTLVERAWIVLLGVVHAELKPEGSH
jgi:hypothetical protein